MLDAQILSAKLKPDDSKPPGKGSRWSLLQGGLLGGPFEGARVLPRNDESSGTFLR